MNSEDTQNRMGEKPELEAVRATLTKPTLWERTGQRWLASVRSSTGLAVIMFIAILAVIGIGAWILTS